MRGNLPAQFADPGLDPFPVEKLHEFHFFLRRLQFNHHGDFITLRKLGALETVGPDLLRQHVLGDLGKAQLPEKPDLIGQGKHLVNTESQGVADAKLHQFPAKAKTLNVFGHHQRAHFGQFLPGDGQGAAPGHPSGFRLFGHHKIPKMGL